MIRVIVVVLLLFVVIEYEQLMSGTVTEKAERQHLVQTVLHTCQATAPSPPALERCHAAGLHAVDRLASTDEWDWRR